MHRFNRLCEKVRNEFPGFEIVDRDRSWLRIPFAVLSFITRQDYSQFTTTIFSKMYVGRAWHEKTDEQRYRNLRHELMHMRQAHYWPLGPRWRYLNHILFAICYLLLPLPVFWTFRAKFEREGYTQTMLVEYEINGPISPRRAEYIAEWLTDTFSSSMYFWMWTRRRAYAWVMKTIGHINNGKITNPRDKIEAREEMTSPLPGVPQ